jgi:hypothetical protein
LKLLEAKDCPYLPKFRSGGLVFPEASSVASLKASEDVQAILEKKVQAIKKSFTEKNHPPCLAFLSCKISHV